MEPFIRLTSVVVPLGLANVDTDQLIPARFLKKPRAGGYQHYLLHDLRHDPEGRPVPEFPLNRPEYRDARIMLAGPNFGCGSSREGAVYALVDAGFRAVVAPSFGDIFFGNALKNGLLPVLADAAIVGAMGDAAQAEPGVQATVDLEAQMLRMGPVVVPFRIDPFRRECLLKGIDEIDLTLQYADAIQAFREGYWADRPWLRLEG